MRQASWLVCSKVTVSFSLVKVCMTWKSTALERKTTRKIRGMESRAGAFHTKA